MRRPRVSSRLLGLVGVAIGAAADPNWATIPSDSNICGIYQQQTAVLGDYVYVAGGYILQNTTNDTQYEQAPSHNKHIWRIPVANLYESNNIEWLALPSDVPEIVGGHLWADEDKLYLSSGYNGAANVSDSDNLYEGGDLGLADPASLPDAQVNYVWSWSNSTGNWTKIAPNSGISTFREVAQADVFVPELSAGFILGGIAMNQENGWIGNGLLFFDGGHSEPVADFLEFNTDNQTWTALQSANSTRVSGAQAFFVPAGEQGMIVSFGGYNEQEIINNFTHVEVYDIAGQTWYNQTTYGDIPPWRMDFTGVSVSASDKSSYEIFIYLGRGWINGSQETMYNEVRILSLPTFEWFTGWTAQDLPSDENAPSRSTSDIQYGASLEMVSESYMLTIGGRTYSQGEYGLTNSTSCDSIYPDNFFRLNNVFDLSELAWTTISQISQRPYTPPSIVSSAVDGKSAPTDGFDDPALATVFSKKPSWESDSTSSDDSKPRHNRTVLIACLAAILPTFAIALAVGAYFLWRRRNNKKKNAPADQDLPLYSETENKDPYTEARPEVEGSELAHEVDGSQCFTPEVDGVGTQKSKPAEVDSTDIRRSELMGDSTMNEMTGSQPVRYELE